MVCSFSSIVLNSSMGDDDVVLRLCDAYDDLPFVYSSYDNDLMYDDDVDDTFDADLMVDY